MRTIIDIVKNDKGYDLIFVLRDYDGEVVNLNTIANLYFKVQLSGEEVLKFTGDMEVVDSGNGEIKYKVKENDFDEVGRYYAEIEAVFEDGQIVTYGDMLINVKSDLPKEI